MTASLSDILAVLNQIRAELPDLIARSKIAPKQIATISGLSDISERMGLIRSGEFRSGNNVDPGSGFTGVRIGYPAFVYDGQRWHIVGLLNDGLQFGLNAEDGKAYFAAGQAVMDAEALKLTGLTYGFQHTAVYSGNMRIGKIGMFLPSGSSVPSFLMSYEGPAGDELVTNGGAESADTTGWTDSDSAWSSSDASPYAGTYSFYHAPNQDVCPGKLTQVISSLSEFTYYNFSFASKRASGYLNPYALLVWKNSGGMTLRTDRLDGDASSAWSLKSETYLSPSGTASCTIELYPGDTFETVYFDGVTFSSQSVAAKFYFDSAGDLHFINADLIADENQIKGTNQTIADDGVYSFTPTNPSGFILLSATDATMTTVYIMASYYVTGPNMVSIVAGSGCAVTTGALTGTTGTDTKVTLSAHTDGKIYIENRSGASENFQFILFGG